MRYLTGSVLRLSRCLEDGWRGGVWGWAGGKWETSLGARRDKACWSNWRGGAAEVWVGSVLGEKVEKMFQSPEQVAKLRTDVKVENLQKSRQQASKPRTGETVDNRRESPGQAKKLRTRDYGNNRRNQYKKNQSRRQAQSREQATKLRTGEKVDKRFQSPEQASWWQTWK